MADPLVVLDLTPLDTDSRWRGYGRYIRTLAKALQALPSEEKRGLRLVGLTGLSWSGRCEITDDLASFEGSVPDEHLNKSQHMKWAYRERVALAPAMARLGAKVLHMGAPDATPIGIGLTGCTHLVTCHDLISLRFPDHYFGPADGWSIGGRLLQRRRYAGPDHLVVISDATATDVQRYLGVPSGKMSRVYNSIELDVFTPADRGDDRVLEKHGLSRGGYLLYVGDLDWRKNVEGMLHGLARAKASGVDLPLVFAGKLGPAKVERLEHLAREAGVLDRVRRIGFVADPELAALYRGAVAHVFVSRAEGFGLTVAEAMACGCPVITTAGTSLAEVAGDAGLVVDPEDHAAIGAAMVLLATDENLRDSLRRKGIARAQLFAPEQQARGTLAVYKKLLG